MWWDLGPCGEGEFLSSSPTAKAFSHQEGADGTWLQFGPLLYSLALLFQQQLQREPLCSWGIAAFCLLQHLVGK